MYTKAYYEMQLETFKKLKENCTNKGTLVKLNRVISKYESYIEKYDSTSQSVPEEECHCTLCVLQG
ncbi:hypothetical protein DMO16_02105 [Fictibacillus sp. S7]|nr:hypothetical protein DMO16_02105 [Fictibacillus sp. S7]